MTPIRPGPTRSRTRPRVGTPLLASAGLAGPAGRPSLSARRHARRLRAHAAGRHGRGRRAQPQRSRGVGSARLHGAGPQPRSQRGRKPPHARVAERRDGTARSLRRRPRDLDRAPASSIAAPAARTRHSRMYRPSPSTARRRAARGVHEPGGPGAGDTSGVDAVHVRDVATQLLKRVGDASSDSAGPVRRRKHRRLRRPVGATRHRSCSAADRAIGTARGLRLAALDSGDAAAGCSKWSAPPPRRRSPERPLQRSGRTASVLVRTCASSTSCSSQQLRAPGSTAPALATAVAASRDIVCALLQGSGQVAVRAGGRRAAPRPQAGLPGRALGVIGRRVVFTTATTPARSARFALQRTAASLRSSRAAGHAPLRAQRQGLRRLRPLRAGCRRRSERRRHRGRECRLEWWISIRPSASRRWPRCCRAPTRRATRASRGACSATAATGRAWWCASSPSEAQEGRQLDAQPARRDHRARLDAAGTSTSWRRSVTT